MEGVCSHLRVTLHVCGGMCPLGTSGRGIFPPTCHTSCVWWDVPSRDQWKGYVPAYVPRFMDGWEPSSSWFNDGGDTYSTHGANADAAPSLQGAAVYGRGAMAAPARDSNGVSCNTPTRSVGSI